MYISPTPSTTSLQTNVHPDLAAPVLQELGLTMAPTSQPVAMPPLARWSTTASLGLDMLYPGLLDFYNTLIPNVNSIVQVTPPKPSGFSGGTLVDPSIGDGSDDGPGS